MPVGARTLATLALPPNVEILDALAETPRSVSDLMRVVGDPPRTTAHKRLRELVEFGVLSRHRRREFPRQGTYELTAQGERLLSVRSVLARWLAESPTDRVTFGSPAGKRAIEVLLAGWNSSIVSSLADEPRSLTELSRLLHSAPYPTLERRLAALREVGLVSIAEGSGRGTPYEPTEWLRRAAAPLLVAAALEQGDPVGSAIGASEMRALLLLALPLVRLPRESKGSLVIAIYSDPDTSAVPGRGTLLGGTIEISGGRVANCHENIDLAAPNWAVGTPSFWLDVALKGKIDRLRIGGSKPQLGVALATGVHQGLAAH